MGFENSLKCPLYTLRSSSGRKQSSQAGWLSLTFFFKSSTYGDKMAVIQADMRKDGWIQIVEICERV